jgi:hypothetical protein
MTPVSVSAGDECSGLSFKTSLWPWPMLQEMRPFGPASQTWTTPARANRFAALQKQLLGLAGQAPTSRCEVRIDEDSVASGTNPRRFRR